MRATTLTALIGALTVSMTGCTSNSDTAGPVSATTPTADTPWPGRATITVPSLQPPPQTAVPPGEKPIIFDPCTYIPDDLIRKAGGKPETRRRSDFNGEMRIFTCLFRSKEPLIHEISFSALSVSLAQIRSRTNALSMTNIKVNGRDAARFTLRGSSDTCKVAMQAPDGALQVSITPEIGETSVDTCAAATRAAEIIEPTLEGK